MSTKQNTPSVAKDTAAKQKVADVFKGVDETMELDKEEQKQLTEFETINKEGKDIEFDKVQLKDLSVKQEHRRVPVPRHRFTPLKNNWDSILKTLVEHMKL
jgi:RNA-binding protein PNO1